MIKHDPKPVKVEEKCPKCDKTFKRQSYTTSDALVSVIHELDIIVTNGNVVTGYRSGL